MNPIHPREQTACIPSWLCHNKSSHLFHFSLLSFHNLHEIIKILVVLVAVVPGVDTGSNLGSSPERGLGASLLLGLQGLLGGLLLLVGKSGQAAGILADIDITDTLRQLAKETFEERGIKSLFLFHIVDISFEKVALVVLSLVAQ